MRSTYSLAWAANDGVLGTIQLVVVVFVVAIEEEVIDARSHKFIATLVVVVDSLGKVVEITL